MQPGWLPGQLRLHNKIAASSYLRRSNMNNIALMRLERGPARLLLEADCQTASVRLEISRRRSRGETTLANQTPPCSQQIRIDVVPRRNGPHADARLVRLGNYPQLLLHAPASPPFAGADDLDRAVRHRFKVTLRWALRSQRRHTSRGQSKAGLTSANNPVTIMVRHYQAGGGGPPFRRSRRMARATPSGSPAHPGIHPRSSGP